MTLEEFRTIRKNRIPLTTRNLSFIVLSLAAILFMLVSWSSKLAAANDDSGRLDQQQRQGRAQDMMIMEQNAAVWTPQGLVVLQGNRLLHYTADMQLQQAITLPLPQKQDQLYKNLSEYSST